MADKEGYGFLFPKKDREGNQPNVTGNIILNGQTVKLSGWTKTSKGGDKYISLKAEDYESALAGGQTATDDDIPF